MASGRAPAAMETTTDIEYDQFGCLLQESALAPTPGEAHGILCGLICGGAPNPERAWLNLLFPPPNSGDSQLQEALTGLDALARQTHDGLQGRGLSFIPLAPDDACPLVERATALYDWVRGFLFAFGVLGIAEHDLPEQTCEVLRDFTDITRLDLGQLSESEEDESALTELLEFVRVAAMLVYEEQMVSSMGGR